MTFCVVFLCISGLFYLRVLRGEPVAVPRFVILPFTSYFFWLWLSLLQNPPVDVFLFSISKVFLYFLFAVFIFSLGKDVGPWVGGTVLILGLVESVAIGWNYTRLHPIYLEQFGGVLANPLHSGILIPVASLVALVMIHAAGRDKRKSILYGAAFALALYATYLLRARAAMLSIACLSLLFLPKAAWKPLISAGLILVLCAPFVFKDRFLAYLEIDPHGLISTTGRFSIWKTDLLAILHRPLLGVGLGNFEFAFMQHHQPASEWLRYGKTTIFAHNGILQTAVEAGVPAALFLIWGFVIFALRLPLTSKSYLCSRWYVLALFVYALTSLFNYSLFLPFNGLVFAAALALSVHDMDKTDTPLFKIQSAKLSLSIIMVCLSLFLSFNAVADCFAARGRNDLAVRFMPFKAEYWTSLAMQKLPDPKPSSTNDYKQAIAYLDKAITSNSNDPFIWSRKARVLIMRHSSNDLAVIADAFARAKTIAPYHAPFWLENGFFDLSIKDWNGARENFQRAAELEPITPLPFYGLGVMFMTTENFSAATNALQIAKVNKQQQAAAESQSAYNREIIATAYGQYLYSVDLASIDKLLADCASHK